MIDLDQAKLAREAARREANEAGPVVKFGGKEYELAAELPYGVLEALRGIGDPETAAAALSLMTEALLGSHYDDVKASGPSVDDINELVTGAMAAYGLDSPLELSDSSKTTTSP